MSGAHSSPTWFRGEAWILAGALLAVGCGGEGSVDGDAASIDGGFDAAGDGSDFPDADSANDDGTDGDVAAPYVCVPDEHEPNDAPEDASSQAGRSTFRGTVCDGDRDFHRLDLVAGCENGIAVRSDPRLGDMDIELVTPGGEILAGSYSDGPEEWISAWPGVGEELLLHVFHVDRGPGLPYEVELTTYCLPGCPDDDPAEPNDRLSEAHLLEDGDVMDLVLCDGNADYYRLEAEAGCQLAVTGVHHGYATVFELLDAGGELVMAGDPSDFNERLLHRADAAGAFYVRVTTDSAAAGVPYGLAFSQVCSPEPACPDDDALEPNGRLVLAAPLPIDGELDAIICDDVDIYTAAAAPGCRVAVELRYELDRSRPELATESQALGLELFTGSGSLDASASGIGADRVEGRSEVGERLYVVVFGEGVEAMPYSLRTTMTCARCPEDDEFEDNDSLAGAQRLPSELPTPAIACEGDPDLFAVEGIEGCEIGAELLGARAVPGTGLRLLDPSGAEVATATADADGGALLSATATSSDTYYAEVTGSDAPYAVLVRSNCCPGDDLAEPNDTVETASALADDPVRGVLCGDNRDLFRFDGLMGCQVTVRASFSHDTGDLDLRLFDEAGATLGVGSSTTDDELVSVVLDQDGPVLVEVMLFGGDPGETIYELDLRQVCP